MKAGRWETLWDWISVYRQLFLWIVLANLILIILAAVGAFPWAHEHRVQFAAATVLVCVLARNEVFLRAVYYVLIKSVTIGTPDGLGTLWAPVFLRNLITNFLLHVGGVHSGCGIASLMWLIYGAVFLVIDRHQLTIWVILLGYALMAVIFLCCLCAIPVLRFHHHNVFERLHRYTGWVSLIIMAGFLVLLAAGEHYRWSTFLTSYWFWVTIVIAALVALPWCCVRRVPTVHESPSSKRISLLKFPSYVGTGLYGRISRDYLSQWHVFGCFSESTEKPHHFMICSAVGDFTKELVSEPPEFLYTRVIKFPGFSYCHRMYDSGVAICTGAAIGVFISLFSNRGLTNFSLIWVGSAFEDTYGTTVVNMLLKGCPGDKLTLYDTKVRGRPDLVGLAADAFRKQRAEVVFCVSNLEGTRSLVRGCRRMGIPAFGPIWDA